MIQTVPLSAQEPYVSFPFSKMLSTNYTLKEKNKLTSSPKGDLSSYIKGCVLLQVCDLQVILTPLFSFPVSLDILQL